MVLVIARWWRADRPVYLRGKILPVSVTKRTQACGVVKGISAGVGVCCCVSVVLMAKLGRQNVNFRVALSMAHFQGFLQLNGHISTALQPHIPRVAGLLV